MQQEFAVKQLNGINSNLKKNVSEMLNISRLSLVHLAIVKNHQMNH